MQSSNVRPVARSPQGGCDRRARARESGSDRANRQPEFLGDAGVVEPSPFVEFERLPLGARQRVEDLAQLLADFVSHGHVQRVVATLVELTVLGRDVLVMTPPVKRAAQVLAPEHDRSDQPSAYVLWSRDLIPKRQQRLLDGVFGEMVAAHQPPRDTPYSVEVGCGVRE